jgi:glycosyltransferase involved in cell wall biosynthesis
MIRTARNKRIVYIQYTNPAAYPPLERSSQVLADAGWSVLVLGLVRPGTEPLRFPPHPRITERYLFNASTGWRLRLHYAWFVVWVLGSTLLWRARWVYASDVLSCPVALLLSLVPGVKVLYHEHDEPAARAGVFARAQQAVREIVARRASLRVLPNESRAQLFEKTASMGRPALRVWNCPRTSEVAVPRNGREPDAYELSLVYSGSVTPERLPPILLEAMARTPARVRLRVIGYETVGHPGYVDQLQRYATQLGIGADVQFVGALARHHLHHMWREADVGLALCPMESLSNNSRWMVGASNKPFDYMANGLALLVSDLDEWREAFVAPGFGIACDPDDAASVADALRWLAEHPVETRAMGECGRQQIARYWNYEAQFAPVLERLCESAN